LQEKDEAEKNIERVKQSIQKIYREILEIPVVIEATIEEQIKKTSEVIQGFCNRIRESGMRATPGTPTEEKEKREIKSITLFSSIKSLSEECVRLCEESM
jgi:hypothetical protein